MQIDLDESPNRSWSSLPPELISHIWAYLTFHEIAKCREVCQTFYENGKRLLNKEARRILGIGGTGKNWVDPPVKRNKTYEITLVEDLYNDYYKKYIEDNTSCFVAGAILDLANEMIVFRRCCGRRQLRELFYCACYHFRRVAVPLIKKRKARKEKIKRLKNTIKDLKNQIVRLKNE